VFCWELASILKNQAEKLQEKGIELVAIGIGDVEKARMFCDETGFPAAKLYCDTGKTYRDIGFRKGVRDTFFREGTAKSISLRFANGGDSTLKEILPKYGRAWLRDGSKWLPPQFEQSIEKGLEQGLQQGGQFVFKGQKVVFAHFDTGTAAHSDIDVLMDKAEETNTK